MDSLLDEDTWKGTISHTQDTHTETLSETNAPTLADFSLGQSYIYFLLLPYPINFISLRSGNHANMGGLCPVDPDEATPHCWLDLCAINTICTFPVLWWLYKGCLLVTYMFCISCLKVVQWLWIGYLCIMPMFIGYVKVVEVVKVLLWFWKCNWLHFSVVYDMLFVCKNGLRCYSSFAANDMTFTRTASSATAQHFWHPAPFSFRNELVNGNSKDLSSRLSKTRTML